MKNIICFIALFLMSFSAFSQIKVSLQTKISKYLSYERIIMTVTVQNNTGTTLRFDDNEESYMNFIVADKKNKRVYVKKAYKNFNHIYNAMITAGASKSYSVAVNQYYPMSESGHY